MCVKLAGKSSVIVNMDETSLSSKIVTKYGMWVPGAEHNMQSNATPGGRRVAWTCSMKAMICNKPEIMQNLPQIILPKYANQESPPMKLKQCYADMGSPVQAWHKTSGWSTTPCTILWLRCVVKALREKCPNDEHIILIDCASTHVNVKLLREAYRLRVHVLLVPSKCTWLLQPLDAYVFASFKRTLRRKLAREEVKSPTGAVKLPDRLKAVGETIQEELVNKSWSAHMGKVGLSTDLTKLNTKLRNLTKDMDLSLQPPSQDDLRFLIGKHVRESKLNWNILLMSTPVKVTESACP